MDPFSAYATTGLKSPMSFATGAPALHTSAGPSAQDNSAVYHPDHPLFWVAGIVLVTFGLIGANSAVRIGKFKASLNAGKA